MYQNYVNILYIIDTTILFLFKIIINIMNENKILTLSRYRKNNNEKITKVEELKNVR